MSHRMLKNGTKEGENPLVLVLDLIDRPIAYHRIFVRLTGSVTSAVLLSQAIYWSKRTSNADGWFYKTAVEWMEETGLSEEEQSTARKKLRSAGFWQEKREGLPARLYYRIDCIALQRQLLSLQATPDIQGSSQNPVTTETRSRKLQKQELNDDQNKRDEFTESGFTKPPDLDSGKHETINNETEITTKITTEILSCRLTEEHKKEEFSIFSLGKIGSKRLERLVKKHLVLALQVFEAINEARIRIDSSATRIKPSYEQLGKIAERLENGATIDQCLHVVKLKEKEAKADLTLVKWLNPITPFKAENFATLVGWSLRSPDVRSPSRDSAIISRYKMHEQLVDLREQEAKRAYESSDDLERGQNR